MCLRHGTISAVRNTITSTHRRGFMKTKSRNVLILVLALGLLVPAGWGLATAQKEDVPMVPANFSQLAEKAKPGVVNIRTERTIKGGGKVFRHFFGDPFGGRRNPFEKFFGPFSDEPQRDFKQRSLGSGFIIDKEGFIVTNNHVVAEADEIKVKLSDDKEFDATVVGRDPKTDLALIKIEGANGLEPLPVGDSENLQVGTWVVAIGSPFGLEQTVTAGIVSAKGRFIGAGPYDDFIQTDASINPGNSGGPLLDMQGRVVGINTAIVASGQGIGFAIPINLAENIIAQLKDKGEVSRGWLGVGIQDITPELAEYYGMESQQGVLITQVFKDDPADKAGLKSNDIIISVDGNEISTARELSGIIANIPVRQKTRLKILRGGKEMTVTATLANQPKDLDRASVQEQTSGTLGLQVAELSPERAKQFGLDADESGALVVDVESDSRAGKADIQVGDLIKGINRQKVDGLDDYRKIMDRVDQDKEIMMLIQRRNEGLKAVKIEP
jgi:serine protease Do